MDRDNMLFGAKSSHGSQDPQHSTEHYIAVQPAQRRRGDSPRFAARLAQRRARRGQRLQPGLHTVMKVTQRHLARIYGSAVCCGVSPVAAEARINMLLSEAQDEGLAATLSAAMSDTDRMSADDSPSVGAVPAVAACRQLVRQASVEVSSLRADGAVSGSPRGAQSVRDVDGRVHAAHACAPGATVGEWAVRNAAQLNARRQRMWELAVGMESLNVAPGGDAGRPMPR